MQDPLALRFLAFAVAALLALAGPPESARADTETFPATADTWVWSAVPDNNLGSSTVAEVGRTVDKSGTVLLKRALLHFDLAALPAGTPVTAATLRLFIERTSADPLGLALTVSRLQTGFVEGDGTTGVTWNTQPAVEPAPTNTGTMNTLVGAWFELDVTAVVLAARASPDPANVWLRIAPTDETTVEVRDFAFRTRESGTGSERAQLVLDDGIPTPTFTPTPVPPPTSTATGTPTVTPTDTPSGPPLPPDPATVAPPIDRSVATDFYDATTFLYTAPTPIQGGVAPGTIEPRRAAVIRGDVRTRAGAPLPGITVTILDHPEFGSTLTRADGMFDLVVNGGGSLVVQYQDTLADAPDYIPVQRQVAVPWQRYVWAPEVVMIEYDVDTPVSFPTTGLEAARGSPVVDDGPRRATVMFKAGTTAEYVMPNGTTVAAQGVLRVRATEYTVGATGPAAMPAELPPESGYTYCVELSADEAITVGAAQVRFSPAAVFYLENFLNLPVGDAVPTGYYDRVAGSWVPSENGRIIRIVSELGGQAQLDTDGLGYDGGAALGIDAAERQKLAELYDPEQTLWRVPIPHFTPWDHNWALGPSEDAEEPDADLEEENEEDCQERAQGSVIGCENQTLGESLPIAGTPFRLSYESDRADGRVVSRTRTIRLTGATVPADLKRIELDVEIAGQLFHQTVADDPSNPAQTIAPNLRTTFTWDGRDAYGRALQGAQPLSVSVGYVYDGVYYQARSDFERAFARVSGIPLTGNRARAEITLWRYMEDQLIVSDQRPLGLGGWTLDVHHSYDPTGRSLRNGGGGQRRARLLPRVLRVVAGGGTVADGDGGPAVFARLPYPRDVAAGPDGSVYIAEDGSETNTVRVRRVTPDGIVSTVAGRFEGGVGYSGDGGPATAAQFGVISGIDVGRDGSLYIATPWDYRVRRVGPDGIVTTVAGDGQWGSSGDGGLATAAQLIPVAVAVGRDGSLFVAARDEWGSDRIRKVGRDGYIHTVAGGGSSSDDGVLATDAVINAAAAVAVGPDGDFYFAENFLYHRVRRVGADGRVTTVAGTYQGFAGDGGPATAALLSNPQGIAVARDGSVYIADSDNDRIRRVAPDGVITTVAGGGGLSAVDGPALGAYLGSPSSVATGADGELLVAEYWNWQVRRITVPFGGVSTENRLVPAPDGTEVYEFAGNGRHLRTYHALTGAVRYEFGYDSQNRLASIVDGDGNVTRIDHTGSSATVRGPYAQESPPYAQATLLTFDANGYLDRVSNPNTETIDVDHASNGLLERLTDARLNAWTFVYDGAGRLQRDDDPAGGSQSLERSTIPTGYQVTRRTAEGRATVYAVELPPDERRVRRVTAPDLTVTTTVVAPDAQREQTRPDQTVRTVFAGPDDRFGMQAAVADLAQEATPGGLVRSVTTLRETSLADPADLLSVTQQTETVTINGRPFTTVFAAGPPPTRTATSAAGRAVASTLDGQGRVVRTAASGLHPVRYGYDARGRLTTITHGPDPDPAGEARVTTLTYKDTTDAQNGYLDTVTDAENRTVQYTYDGTGRVLTQTFLPGTPDERVITYGYDANGNLTAVTPPGQPLHEFQYTPVNLGSLYLPPQPEPPLTTPEHPETGYHYTLDRRLDYITRPDGGIVDFTDDDFGRLDFITLPGGEVRDYAYYPNGQLETLSAADAVLGFTWDGFLLDTETWTIGAASHAVIHGHDNDFRLNSLQVDSRPPVLFQYDDDGLLEQAGDLDLTPDPDNGFLRTTTLNGGAATVSDDRTYTLFGELETYRAGLTTLGDLYQVDYERDRLGRITKRSESIAGGAPVDTFYTYDPAGRLWRVCGDDLCTALQSEYFYDGNGNRLAGSTTATAGDVLTATYDDQDRLLAYATDAGSATYTYTANGELRTKTVGTDVTRYSYDAFGNLRRVVLHEGQPNETTIDYLVDGRNRRIGKKVDSVLVKQWLYQDQLEPVAELGPSGAVLAEFVYGSKPHVPDYFIRYDEQSGQPTGTYRIISDQLGSPRLIVDLSTPGLSPAERIMQRLDYDEFGNVLSDTNPGFQPFGFAGGIDDGHTALQRFGARDYDPRAASWTVKDPSGFGDDGANLYGYATHDPINLIDRSGNGSEHTKDARPGTQQRHEEGQSRQTVDQGGERADSMRAPKRKRPIGWKGPWPPRACVMLPIPLPVLCEIAPDVCGERRCPSEDCL